ncbi:hypothetical protein ACFOED_04175 [Vulcaniibacterium thermophilum]|uniref:Uncharacterized protein n=1 Tax=Vulcaniibacterium thermophilum TaxID=1169913 RepID=A0A918YVT5_9GAMM|nr:hypothetical protein [Vulcaniibacterium thermophilum]GHE26376.1 hypothetical protein GCM10007167_04470 [Vulcaniibacterium thermophilum]
MSSIRPDPRLDRPGLDGLGGDAPSLEELRGRDVPRAADAAAEAVLADTAPPGAAVDAGEHVLNAPAWAGVAPPRLLNAEPVLQRTLAALELAPAADHAADAVLDPLV